MRAHTARILAASTTARECETLHMRSHILLAHLLRASAACETMHEASMYRSLAFSSSGLTFQMDGICRKQKGSSDIFNWMVWKITHRTISIGWTEFRCANHKKTKSQCVFLELNDLIWKTVHHFHEIHYRIHEFSSKLSNSIASITSVIEVT